MSSDAPSHDVLVVGGGPAGLSAALILGRARRTVALFDDGNPRNASAVEMHGLLTRDGTPPGDMHRLARAELARYPTIERINASVVSALPCEPGFLVRTKSGGAFTGKRLLIATGVFDQLPPLEGLDRHWGKSVFVCPFCDGWEVRDKRIAVYGSGRDAVELAQELRGWSSDLIVAVETDDLTDRDRRWLEASGVPLHAGTLRALGGADARLEFLEFSDGERIRCDALFVCAPLRQHSPLFAELGCRLTSEGMVAVSPGYATSVPGCYAAGDAVTKHHQVVFAVASGAAAAVAISCELLQQEADELVAAPDEPVAAESH